MFEAMEFYNANSALINDCLAFGGIGLLAFFLSFYKGFRNIKQFLLFVSMDVCMLIYGFVSLEPILFILFLYGAFTGVLYAALFNFFVWIFAREPLNSVMQRFVSWLKCRFN